MTSSRDFRRPDDVSQEEEKSLLLLFDELLQKERKSAGVDQLALDFQSELQTLNVDGDSRNLLESVFKNATDGDSSESDCARFISTLQELATKDLTNEEYDSLRRLEFIFAAATALTEAERRFAAEEKRKRKVSERNRMARESLEAILNMTHKLQYEASSLLRSEFAAYGDLSEICALAERIERLAEDALFKTESILYMKEAAHSVTMYCLMDLMDPGKSVDPIARLKAKVLWDILGDARPRTPAEFAQVLRDRGIILRHSP